MENHEARLEQAKIYQERQQKRRGRPPKNEGQTDETRGVKIYYVQNGHKIIEKTKDIHGNVYSKYLGRKTNLKEFLEDKELITWDQDLRERKVS